MIALDTNLLVYAHRSAVVEHRSARQAIVRAHNSSGGWGFSLPVVGEFWSVVTHPTAAGRPSAPEEAHCFIVALEAAGAEIWTPGRFRGAPEPTGDRFIRHRSSGSSICRSR